MKRPLLELVQDLLSSIDGDEVNSISDTMESMQVATLLRGVYYDMSVELELDEHKGLFQLVASNDIVKEPTTMTVPAHVTEVDWIKYDNVELRYCSVDDFLTRQELLRADTTRISSGEIKFSSISNDRGEEFSVPYLTNVNPTYYTSFDDNKVVFNSLNSVVDSTLQNSKSTCFGSHYAEFLLTDTFIPDLDGRQFPYYINRAKVRTFAEIKQTSNKEASSETRNQKLSIRRLENKIQAKTSFQRVPKYGR